VSKRERESGVRAASLLATVAAGVLVVDLAQTGRAIAAGPVPAHGRSAGYVALALALCACWTLAILLTRSASIAAAGGVVLGGALGNVTALVLWPSVPGVPDPLLWRSVALSLGDVAIATGLVLVVTAATVFGLRNRDRLREPVLRRG
jgi:hypothetical protein